MLPSAYADGAESHHQKPFPSRHWHIWGTVAKLSHRAIYRCGWTGRAGSSNRQRGTEQQGHGNGSYGQEGLRTRNGWWPLQIELRRSQLAQHAGGTAKLPRWRLSDRALNND